MVMDVIGLLCSEVARNKVDNCFDVATLQLGTELYLEEHTAAALPWEALQHWPVGMAMEPMTAYAVELESISFL